MLVPLMTVPILIFSIIVVITSVALALFVLMHKGRGGGLSDLFGGGISSSLGGSSVAERNLDRLTVIIGVVWLAAIVALNLLYKLGYLTAPNHRPVNRLKTDTKLSTARKGEGERTWLVEVPFVAAGWALVRWARPSGAMPRRGSTSHTSAHTVMRRGPHLPQMPRFPTHGTAPDAACQPISTP